MQRGGIARGLNCYQICQKRQARTAIHIPHPKSPNRGCDGHLAPTHSLGLWQGMVKCFGVKAALENQLLTLQD